MNPEEGLLRPQLLDRFGLMVEVVGPRDPELRIEVVRRRVAFDANPVGFVDAWSAEQQALRGRIAAARQQLSDVVVHDEMLQIISQICCQAGALGDAGRRHLVQVGPRSGGLGGEPERRRRRRAPSVGIRAPASPPAKRLFSIAERKSRAEPFGRGQG